MSDNHIRFLAEPGLLGLSGSGLAVFTFGEDITPDSDELGPDVCYCGDPDCWHWGPSYRGYLFCRPCGEHHRPPECAIDEHGHALAPDGTPWKDMP